MDNEYKNYKADRVLKLLFRALKGESLSVAALADESNVSTRSITRDINDLKAFLADHRDILKILCFRPLLHIRDGQSILQQRAFCHS